MAETLATPVSSEIIEKTESIAVEPVAATEVATTEETEAVASEDEKVKTVFDSTVDFTVKHPLKHTWTLWYTKPQHNKAEWGDSLKEVVSFDSVEEFWGVYNNVPKASDLPQKSDYHLFKQGVRPEWEDRQNTEGGKWAYQCREKRLVDIDDLWLSTLLGAIGETLEEEGDSEIMGVVVTIRKAHYRLSVWTKTANNERALLSIGRRFKELLKLPANEPVEFSSHKDAAASGSSRAKPKLSV
ncbi:translation initiation factor eIF 4e-like domain-containing protein [Lipomyces arxii]|uniref:translation initiation factor eIF 4e-like domain-containing protein n=1 Tax=Lipomyces arxii TaxID=56418 RepID=UPI0034CD448C